VVICNPVYIEKVSKALLPFSENQFLPNGIPLKKWKDKNDAWIKIQEGLLSIIKDVKTGKTREYFE
jgi:hypothetical protein